MDEHQREQCRLYGGGPDHLAVWEDLSQLLSARPIKGWRFEVYRPDRDPFPCWCLGLDRASRLTVSALEGRVLLHRADIDDEQMFHDVEGFAQWLDVHEREHEGYTPLQKQLMDESFSGIVERLETGEQ